MRAARLLGVAELGTAVIICLVATPLAAIPLVILGLAFASAGCWALLAKRRVECNCFGPMPSGSKLGATQLLYLPLWLLAAVGVAVAADSISEPAERLALLGAASAAAAAASAAGVLRAVAPLTQSRLSDLRGRLEAQS